MSYDFYQSNKEELDDKWDQTNKEAGGRDREDKQ